MSMWAGMVLSNYPMSLIACDRVSKVSLHICSTMFLWNWLYESNCFKKSL